jgi:APA family basic amino acid/polyamine antiporter
MKHGHLNAGFHKKIGYKIVSMTGFGLVAILVIVAGLHHSYADADDNGLFYFSMGFALLHLIIYIMQLVKVREEKIVTIEK